MIPDFVGEFSALDTISLFLLNENFEPLFWVRQCFRKFTFSFDAQSYGLNHVTLSRFGPEYEVSRFALHPVTSNRHFKMICLRNVREKFITIYHPGRAYYGRLKKKLDRKICLMRRIKHCS